MTVVPTMIAKGIECLQRAQTETTINAKELIDRSRQHLLAADHYLRDDTTNHALRCDVLLRLADLEFSVGNLTRAMDFCR
jgi:hypothetical protein